MNKSTSELIEKKVRSRMERHFNYAYPRIVVGVSGGPDSMGLLNVLYKLDVPLTIVHLNYEQRGQASDADQRLVHQYAQKRDLACRFWKVGDKVPDNENFQQWARKIRYEYYDRVRREENAQAIAVAHHQDDQIETILLKLFRGSGPSSWAGMPIHGNYVFRPLLDIPKKQLMRYVENEAIPYRIDQTNLETDYARNFIRNEWLPQLNKLLPGWRENILQLTEWAQLFDQMSEALLSSAGGGSRSLQRNKLLSWEQSVQKTVVLYWIKKQIPGAVISSQALDELEHLEKLQTGKSIQLTDQLKILRDRNHFYLKSGDNVKISNLPADFSYSELLEEPQIIAGWRCQIQPFEHPDFEDTLYLNSEKLNWPVTIRQWREGDRFQPLGMEGTQKVKDHLTNRKVSSRLREHALVVEDSNKMIVAVLYPRNHGHDYPGTIAEQVRCLTKTREALTIKRATYES